MASCGSRAVSLAALFVAAGAGSGYAPFAPGTAGSAVGLLLFWPLSWLSLGWQLGVTAAVFVLGTLASSRGAPEDGLKDPGIAVGDEIVGVWIALRFLPLTPTGAATGCAPLHPPDRGHTWP